MFPPNEITDTLISFHMNIKSYALSHIDTCSPAQPGQRMQSPEFFDAPWPHACHKEWSVLSVGSFGISKGQLLGNRRCFSNHQWREEEKERWAKGEGARTWGTEQYWGALAFGLAFGFILDSF